MMFKKMTMPAFIVFALLLGTTLCFSTQKKNVRRIQFPPDDDTVTVKGVLRGTNDMIYIVHGEARQTLIAGITVQGDGQASLIIEGPGKRRMQNENGSDGGDDFSIILPQTGDYRIIVVAPDMTEPKDIARYSLEISLR